MASFNLDSLTVSPRTLDAGEFAVLFRNGNIAAASATALTVFGEATVRNGGAISSITHPAIYAVTPGLFVENTGAITGGTDAIAITPGVADSQVRIVSSGTIHAAAEGHAAIRVDGYGAMVVNTGQIVSLGGYGIDFTPVSWSAHVSTIYNSGHIYARGAGDIAIRGSGGTEDIENVGIISGGVNTGSGADRVVNLGTITGSLDLSNGHDIYEGRTGDVLGQVLGGAGDDSLRAGQSGEHLIGGSGLDSLRGGIGDDTLVGGSGADSIRGGQGADSLLGDDGIDSIWGGADDDYIDGSLLSDQLYGGADDDTLIGGSGWDTLKGGRGDDNLSGGDEPDRLKGGQGADTLTGGAGADVFEIIAIGGIDHITDFANGEDRMNLVDFGLSGFQELSEVATISAGTQGARIDFGSGTVVILDGVAVADIDASDFVF